MKMGQSFRCIFWATLYCVLYLVTATDEDLMDFDFGDLKDVDWNYDNQNSQELFTKSTTKPEENSITFDDDLDLLDDQDEKVHPFDWREKLLRTAMSKALRNKAVRQKFIEVMPILRVLSRQQKLALSALITAQISAKKGHELKLDQVRMMFGDDKSLILPVVYDIANLIKNSAKKYIEFDYTLQDLANFAKPKAEADRRKLELSSVELSDDDNTVGVATLPYTANESKEDEMDDFMDAGEEEEEYLDPMEINKELQKAIPGKPQPTTEHIPIMVADKKKKITETKETSQEVIVDDPIKINMELQKDVPTLELLKGSVPIPSSEKLIISKTTPTPLRRTRRATENRELIHKLVRSVPLSVNEADLQRGLAGRTLKLNTTAFASPKESTLKPTTTAEPTAETILPNGENLEPYQLVEDLAFASLNGSEILLSGDEESKTEDDVTPDTDEPQGETLPTPEELIAGPRYRISANKIINMRSSGSSPKGKRVLAKTRGRPVKGSGVLPPKKCERFTASMCIRTEDYPIDQIMGSIRRHRNAMTALLAEYNDKQPHGLDSSDGFDDYFHSNKRREDTNEVQGGLCQSIVRYARPQKARSASGEWKFIVNTGQHTQTLRLEKCTNPQESCSYLSSNYKSYCSQVYNYHRLLSWDKTRGLHVDIFKVPTCCSCQINGMKQQQFAAVLSSYTKKDFSPVHNREKYHHDTRDYAEDVEEDDDDEEFGFSISGHNHYDANELQSGSSKRVRSKLPSPTVGSYLSPPGDDEFEQYPYKIPRDTASVYKSSASGTSLSSSSSTVGSSKKILRDLARRRPQKSFSSDYQQADLEYAPSEQHVQREVNVFGTPYGKQDRSQSTKTKPIYSVIHTGSSNDSTTAITTSTGTIRALTPSPSTTTGRPFSNTNAHQKPSSPGASSSTDGISTEITGDGTTLLESSVSHTGTATTPSISAASLPAHYYTNASGNGRHKIYRTRVRISSVGTTASNTKASTSTTTIPETTEYSETSPKRPIVPAITSDIFRNPYVTKLNLTTQPPLSVSKNGSTKSHPQPPRRINYSYHPIIDFFEYNRKIQVSPTTSPSTPSSTVKRQRASSVRPSSYLLSSTQVYPHKIPNAVATNIYQPHQQSKQQNKQSSKLNERRMGYGADGEGSSVSPHFRFPNQLEHGDQSSQQELPFPSVSTEIETETADVWHPVIVENF